MLVDMLRQFVITAAVLVVVIAFGAAIKPLSNDSLISPLDAATFVVYAMVPMLQFALPFAAAFAVTLTFHRLSQDNEIIAMAVAGQSYMGILAPFAALGLSLTLLLGVLTQWVIPSFIGKMTESLAADMPRMLTRSIQQHAPFVQGNLVIWAEKVFLGGDDGERIVLDRAAVAKVDEQHRPTMYLTSSATSIDVVKDLNDSSLLVRSKNSVQWTDEGQGAGSTRGAVESELSHAIGISSETSRRPSSMTRSELLQVESDTLLYPPIDQAADQLRNLLVLREYWQALTKHFNAKKEIQFHTSNSAQAFIVRSDRCTGGTFRGSIEVEMQRRNGEKSILVPATARLQAELQEGDIETLTLALSDVRVGVGEVGENRRTELRIQDLTVDADIAMPNIEKNIPELLTRAKEFEKGSIPRAANRLEVQIERLHLQVLSRVNQRWAMSASAFLIVLFGSMTAILFREKTALATFTKVFFPTVIAIILVFAGGQIVRDGRVGFGFGVMWSGNTGVLLLILYTWKQLRCH
jgi:lipopolysaccharide export system permease protein